MTRDVNPWQNVRTICCLTPTAAYLTVDGFCY